MTVEMTTPDPNLYTKAPQDRIDVLPQERITGDILRGHGPRRGNLEKLIKYWRPIMRKPGGFRRCVITLADHPSLFPPQRICAWLHHETTGKWPNEGKHHGRAKRVVRRVVRDTRRKKGVEFQDLVSVDVPFAGDERRSVRESGSVLFQPIAGRDNVVEFKAKRFLDVTSSKPVHTTESVLLPGERGSLNPRHLAQTFLTPGGSGAPGPPLGRRIGGGAFRGFRCPAGFANGGRFSNQALSNCGAQLFALPGQPTTRQAARTVRQAIGARRVISGKPIRRGPGKPKADLTTVRVTDSALAGMAGIGPALTARANTAKQDAATVRTVSAMTRSRQPSASRLIRRDGTVLVPLANISTLARQRKNNDMLGAVLAVKVPRPGPQTGVESLPLFNAGVKRISFVIPGGRIDVAPKKKLTPRDVGKLTAAARGASDKSGFSALQRAAEATGLLTMSAHTPGVAKPNQKIVVEDGRGVRRSVLRWVFELFLAKDAPNRPSGRTPFKVVSEKSSKGLDSFLAKRHREPRRSPLSYTACPIVRNEDEEQFFNSVNYKAALFADSLQDAHETYRTKRASVVWDPVLKRYRCPLGSSFGGRITNRIGTGCGSSIVEGAARAAGQVAQTTNQIQAARARVSHPQRTPKRTPKHRRARKVPQKTRGTNELGAFARALEKIANKIDPDKGEVQILPSRDWNTLSDAERTHIGLVGRAMARLAKDGAALKRPKVRRRPQVATPQRRLDPRRGNLMRRVSDLGSTDASRFQAEMNNAFTQLENDWGNVLGTNDFTFRDLERFIKRRKRDGLETRKLYALEKMRDDWAELRGVVDPPGGGQIAQSDYLDALRRISIPRAQFIVDQADLGKEDRLVAKIREDGANAIKDIEKAHKNAMRFFSNARRLPTGSTQEERKMARALDDGMERRKLAIDRLQPSITIARQRLNDLEGRKGSLDKVEAARQRLLRLEKQDAVLRVEMNEALIVKIRRGRNLKREQAVLQRERDVRAAQDRILNALNDAKQGEAGTGGGAAEIAARVNASVNDANQAKDAAAGLIPRKSRSENLGRFDRHGFAAIEVVPVGNKGMDTVDNAVSYVKDGGDLRDVPNAFLVKSILRNRGVDQRDDKKRFQEIGRGGGVNGMDRMKDTVTGLGIGIKFKTGQTYGHDEDMGEVIGAHIADRFGFAGGAVRVGTPTNDGATPVVIELAHNYLGQLAKPTRPLGEDLTPQDALRATLLDFAILNVDRHGGNFFVKGPSGERHFVPFDHGLGFNSFKNAHKSEGSVASFKSWTSSPTGGQINSIISGLKAKVRQDKISRAEIIQEIATIQKDLRRHEDALPLADYVANSWRAMGKVRDPFFLRDTVKRGTVNEKVGVVDRISWIASADPEQIASLLLDLNA